MNYYVVIIQNDSVCALTKCDSLSSAYSLFHAELAVRTAERNSTVCTILDSNGIPVCLEKYQKSTSEE